MFAFTILFLFVSKAIAEYLGLTEIQYVGLAATRDLRNAFYGKVIRQPMGFFQHNPTGRIISVAINDVDRVRFALSDYMADLFMKSFTFIAFVAAMLILNWKLALATSVLLPVVVLPVNKLGKEDPVSAEKSQTRLSDLSQILEETVSGNRIVKAFGMEDFRAQEISRGGAAAVERKHALGARGGDYLPADGFGECRGDSPADSVCAQSDPAPADHAWADSFPSCT